MEMCSTSISISLSICVAREHAAEGLGWTSRGQKLSFIDRLDLRA